MKRWFSAFLAVILFLTLISACGEPEDTVYSVRDIAASVISGQSGLPQLYATDFLDPEFSEYAPIYLGDLAASVTDGVICAPIGPYACEVDVFRFPDRDSARSAVQKLTDYRDGRAGAFFGYAPEEAELAEAGVAVSRGVFAALFICPDTDGAEKSFRNSFGDSLPEPPALDALAPHPPEPEKPVTPGPDEPYDRDAVVSAFKSGDETDLTPKNLAILNSCRKVLDAVIEDGMEPWEKELAVNDWMVLNAKYDPAELEGARFLTPDPDNDNPYGLLINGVGICLGYAATFQLFMDLLEIECVTVRGRSHSDTEDHAWNQVRLDGDWYCVDVTWDDPVFTGGAPGMDVIMYYARRYFNVTSDYMRATDHQWTSPLPEAQGTKYAYPAD